MFSSSPTAHVASFFVQDELLEQALREDDARSGCSTEKEAGGKMGGGKTKPPSPSSKTYGILAGAYPDGVIFMFREVRVGAEGNFGKLET